MEKSHENLLRTVEHLTEIERWREAVPLLIKIIAADPQNFHANCLLSLCQYHLRDFRKAVEFAERAIAAEPEVEWGHRLRSVALMEAGEKKEALRSAEEAVKLAPDEPFALQTLANALLTCGKTRRAREIALKMRDEFPEMEASFFVLGNVYLQRGDPYEAERCFREALRLNPTSSDARNNLGVALLRQDAKKQNTLFKAEKLLIIESQDDEIQNHFTEAVRLNPGHETAVENLKNQFSYFNILYAFLSFTPFALITFFIAPSMTLFMVLIGIYTFSKLLFEVRKKRKNLSPEMRMFLKSEADGFAFRLNEFKYFAANLHRKTWKPHALAIAALILCYADLGATAGSGYSRSWNQSAAFILVIVSVYWLQSELNKD